VKNYAPLAGFNGPLFTQLCGTDDKDRKKEDLDKALVSSLGSAMFGSALQASNLRTFSSEILMLTAGVAGKSPVSEADVEEYVCAAVEVVNKYQAICPDISCSRDVEVQFLGRKFIVKVPLDIQTHHHHPTTLFKTTKQHHKQRHTHTANTQSAQLQFIICLCLVVVVVVVFGSFRRCRA